MRRLLMLLVWLAAAFGYGQYPVLTIPNVTYTQASGFPQLLDVYLPSVKNVSRRPGIIFVHGGGWSGGSKADFGSWAEYYASRGYVCVSINYRLTPLHVWPAQINDTQAAVRWMRKNAGALGLNPRKIGSVGASAGGHLVLFLGTTDTLNDFDPALSGYSSRVQAVVDFYGPTDMTFPGEWDPGIWNLIEALVGLHWLPGLPAFEAVSPLYRIDAGDAPTLVLHGTADAIVPVAQSRRAVARMQQYQVPVIYQEFLGEGHGWGGQAATVAFQAMDAFLVSQLGP